MPTPRTPADTFSVQHVFDAPAAAEAALASAGRGDRDAITWLSEHVLREHTAGEQEMIAELPAALTIQQWQDVTGSYAARLQRCPTRPHPHASRAGLAGRLAYRASARVDRILDVLDSCAIRPVPTAVTS